MQLLVMKFGGASVATPQSFAKIAEIIERRAKDYEGVVVVVSAMAKTTDYLIKLAKQVHPDPPQREYDMLVSVGERVSVSLLAMALQRRGVAAVSLTGSQSGILTSQDHSQAQILDVRPVRVWDYLKKNQVVIVAGFQGVSDQKDITTLGRGGSDTTAVALGVALDAAQVDFYKDVDGIYNKDPKFNPEAVHLPKLTYEQVLSLEASSRFILHPRCVELAQKNYIPLHILSFKNFTGPGTLVCDERVSRNFSEKYYEATRT